MVNWSPKQWWYPQQIFRIGYYYYSLTLIIDAITQLPLILLGYHVDPSLGLLKKIMNDQIESSVFLWDNSQFYP